MTHGTPVPGISEEHKPYHAGRKEIVDQYKYHNARKILASCGLRMTKGAILATNNILTRPGGELHQPTVNERNVII